MKLYTKTGDEGSTSVIGGRVSKNNTRIDAYGTIDELNSFIGLAISELVRINFSEIVIKELENIQHELFDCGADLANITSTYTYKVNEEMVRSLEGRIDLYTNEVPQLERFILPGGSYVAAILHICRTVCRRAERMVVHLKTQENINAYVLKFLNRLSDYFFALARVMNHRTGVKDIEYNRKN